MDTKRKKILIVDDDTDDLQLITESLMQHDPTLGIIEAKNGKEALSFLNSAQYLPSLIILDINMPVMDGKETLLAVRSLDKFKSIPIVMFTTSSNELDRIYFRRQKVEMLTKPYTIDDMNNLISKLLSNYDEEAFKQ
jgi:CheY-like chemotaxis protein